MSLQLTLRKRLVLLVVAAMVPLLGLAIFNAQLDSQISLSRATDNLKFAVSLAASNQQQITETAHQVLIAMTHVPGIREGRNAHCDQHLNELRQQLPAYANLGIASADGFLLCNGLAGASPVYIGDRSYFRDAVASGRFVAGEYIVGRLSGQPSVAFALPLLDSKGSVVFVAYAALDLGRMAASLAAVQLPAGAGLGIHDRNGALLAGTGLPLQTGQIAVSPVIQEALRTRGTAVREGADKTGQQRLWAYMPTTPDAATAFVVAVSMDRSLVVGPGQRKLWQELAGLTLVTLLGGWLAWMLGGRVIVKPAARILEAAGQFQQGRLGTRITLCPDEPVSEFSHIADGFNRMAQAMQVQQGALEAELSKSREAQQKLRDAQLLARIGYWQFDLATERLSLSEEIFDFLGIDAALFDGRLGSLLTRVHRSDRQAFQAACSTAIQTGTNFDIEFRVVLHGGHVRWIHQFGLASSRSEAGQSPQRTGVIQDITARKNAELAAVRITELLNRTGALAKVGGWELLVDTMTPCWSEETYRIHGVDPALDISFEDAINFFEADARPVIMAAVRAAIDDATPWDMELSLVTATGEPVRVRTQGRALIENGKVVRLAGVMQDITAQHKAQAHARLLETCISHLNEVVIITEAEPFDGPGPRIVFVNDAFKRLTGYSRAEAVGQSPRILQGINTQRSELDRVRASLEKWQPVRFEILNYAKNGSELWLDIDIVPIANEKGWVTHWVAVERDITARKLAEQALASSEQRYAALFNMAPVPMWVYDTATYRYLAVNESACRDYGYSETEFLSMTIFDIRPAAEHEALRSWLADPLRKKTAWHDLRKDGSLFAVETVSRPVQHAGQDARFVIALDKTVQEKTEKDVQDYLFTLQRAADAAQAITWHRTLEGSLQEIAEQARGVIGAHQAAVSLSADGAHAQTMHALSLSEKYEAYRGLMKAAGGGPLHAAVCTSNRSMRLTQAQLEAHPARLEAGRDGEKPLPLRGWLAVPLMGRDGKNIGVLQLSDKYEGEFTKQDEYVALELSHLASTGLENVKLLEEIGHLNAGLEQKVTERTAALVRQEALFRALAEQAPQMIWTASPDGRATYYNRTWFDLMGGTLKDWSGYQWMAAIHPEDIGAVRDAWAVSMKNLSRYAGIRRIRARDGSFHTMSYRASPVMDDQGHVAFWVGVDADVTEIKAIEAALRLSNQELEAFSYSVSHDLRSPLNTIDGFSKLLAKQLAPQIAGDAGVKAGHYLMRIQAGVAQMGQLIEDLLSLSQVSRAQLHTEPVDLSFMARRLLDEWKTRQPGRRVTVTVEQGLQAHGDERLLRVAMENLLSNAWKFTAKTDNAEISVGRQSDLAGLPVFFIKDNGAGFDMAYADKLFHPFQRLHTALEFQGTGIGLATVSRVICRHGGRIWAESAPARGATFFFTLS